jgi:hypothetical protein
VKVWIFADFSVPRNDSDRTSWIEDIKTFRPDAVVLGVNEEPPDRWDFRHPYTSDDFRRAGDALCDEGITPHLMTWVYDWIPYIRDAMDVLQPLVALWPGSSLLFDAERKWLHRENNEVAAAEYIRARKEVPLGLTGYAGVAKMEPRYKDLAAQMDYVLPQAYSNYSLRQPWTSSWWWAPPAAQNAAYANWSASGKPIVMGLGAWHQSRPGLSTNQAMAKAWDACEALGVETVAYWSLRNLMTRPEGTWLRGAR